MARPYSGRSGKAVAPASATDALRRVVGTLHEPNAWTAGILLATGVAIIARHPLARALGTEADTPVVSAPAATAPAAPSLAGHAPAVAAPVLAVPTHAPRNPFAALVKTNVAALAPATSSSPPSFVAQPPTTVPVTTPTTTPVIQQPSGAKAPVPSAGSCSGHVHRVVGGDSLWTLAARAVHSSDSGRVTIAWHRLYDANRSAIGADPSLLRVGTSVCVPTKI